MKKRSLQYDTSRPILDVYLYETRVGTIGQHDDDFWFRYDPWVVEHPQRDTLALSVQLPVQSDTYGHKQTSVFFENLLLESDLRDELAQLTRHDAKDIPGLLGSVGAECSGAVALWPTGQVPLDPPQYREYPKPQLERLFAESHGERLTAAQIDSRQMMSGVQHKLVFLKQDHKYFLPLSGSPSNVILKQPSSRYAGLVANEMLCMRAVKQLGLPVSTVHAVSEMDLLEVERYDRYVNTNGKILKFHQEDFCQVLGRSPRRKYQHAGGPTFRDCAEALRRYSVAAAKDLGMFVKAAIANVVLGNMDAHAKNFSLLTTPEGRRLAPLYDIVCTEVYPVLAPELSMYIGNARNPVAINVADIRRFSKDVGVTPQFVFSTIEDVTTTVTNELPGLIHHVSTELGTLPVLEMIHQFVQHRIAKIRSISTTT